MDKIDNLYYRIFDHDTNDYLNISNFNKRICLEDYMYYREPDIEWEKKYNSMKLYINNMSNKDILDDMDMCNFELISIIPTIEQLLEIKSIDPNENYHFIIGKGKYQISGYDLELLILTKEEHLIDEENIL